MPLPATAQQVCGNHAEIAAQLVGRWGEAVIGTGMAGGNVVEIWAGPAGSFTVLVVAPTGRACILGAGVDWQLLPAPVPGKPA